MIATDMESLDALINTAIRTMTPRATRDQAHAWTPYDRVRDGVAFTRSYRLDWTVGEYFHGGLFGKDGVETEAVLSVVTDYKDREEVVQFLVEDDKHQLRDTINGLMAADNGLLWAEALQTEIEETDEQGAIRVIHPFTIRYLRARA